VPVPSPLFSIHSKQQGELEEATMKVEKDFPLSCAWPCTQPQLAPDLWLHVLVHESLDLLNLTLGFSLDYIYFVYS
jgi:hypothetical protein